MSGSVPGRGDAPAAAVTADPTQVRRDIEEDPDRLRLAGLATARGGVGSLTGRVRTEARLRTVLHRLVGDLNATEITR